MSNKLINQFLKFEHDNCLFDLKIGGVYIWPVIRFRIFNYLFQQYNQTQINHPKNSLFNTYKLFIKNFFDSIIKSPFFRGSKDTIIFSHPRRILNADGFYVCKYTEHLIGESSYVFEVPFQESHKSPVNFSNRVYLDSVLHLSRWYALLYHFKILKKEDYKTVEKLVLTIEKEFNITIQNGNELVVKLLLKHKALLKLASIILSQIKPKKIIVAVAYSDVNLPFVEHAKSMGIKVIELQHGIMGPDHIAYNYYKKGQYHWFPDEIWVWSEIWKKGSKFPISDNKIIVKGFPFLENYRKDRDSNSTLKKSILIISQGPFSDNLINLAEDLLVVLGHEKYNIIFKPHPSEYAVQNTRFEVLSAKGVSIFADGNIYEAFNKSDIQIGVSSTALFEGLEFGLKTFIYKIKGSEIFDDVNGVFFFNDANEIAQQL